MTPQVYEQYVGSLYSEKGYKVTVSPLSNDWGIDVIAIKGKEKIGIQAKMYGDSNRNVNRRVIMELYGAAAYQDCTKAVLATDGNLLSDARQVASKLGIEIFYTSHPAVRNVAKKSASLLHAIKQNHKGIPTFEEAWEKHVMPLKGKTLYNSRGANQIVNVDWSGIERITSNNKIGKIDIEGFRLAYNELLSKSYVSRDFINQQVDKRCSSGIVLILGEALPFVQKETSPLGLRLI